METLSATRESQRISLMGRREEELCRMSDTFYSPYCSVSLSLCVFFPSTPTFAPSPPHHISLRFPPHSSITPKAPCLENKLMFTPSHYTPPQKTLLVHLRPSIADRQYSRSLLIIFLCAAGRASGQEAAGSHQLLREYLQ